jgi:hypothetical protein
MTDKKKQAAELDVCTQAPEFAEHARPNEAGEERQETMDKMSIDTSEAHTYDKSKSDDGEKCS